MSDSFYTTETRFSKETYDPEYERNPWETASLRERWTGPSTDWPLADVKFLNGFSSPLVTLLVGPKQAKITAHEDHLCVIPYFRAILQPEPEEPEEPPRPKTNLEIFESLLNPPPAPKKVVKGPQSIRLPDEDPSAVFDLVIWLTRGNLESVVVDLLRKDKYELALQRVLALIHLAEKLYVTPLRNQLYEALWTIFVKSSKDFGLRVRSAYQDLASRGSKARFIPIHAYWIKVGWEMQLDTDKILRGISKDRDLWRDYKYYGIVLQLAISYSDEEKEQLDKEAAEKKAAGELKGRVREMWKKQCRRLIKAAVYGAVDLQMMPQAQFKDIDEDEKEELEMMLSSIFGQGDQ